MTTTETNAPDKTACIIVAGGSSSRMGHGEPKQFRLLGEEPVFSHSVIFFGNHPSISRVIVVVPQEWISRAEVLLEDLATTASVTVVAGGARRQDSVYAGVAAAADCDYVAVHDGARPFPPANFDECLLAARESGGAVFAMPETDSIKRADGDIIIETVPRSDLWSVQTPQVFSRARLMEALEKCLENKVELTDDASAFEYLGWQVKLIPGSRHNLKITYPDDFVLAEAFLKGRNK